MLSQSQIDLIRASAERIGDTHFTATNAFYASLFKKVPTVRSLFPDDMFEQSKKLWDSIVMVVESADDISEVESKLLDLGARHVKYGAEPAHYPVVADVLIKTISVLMKDEWSHDAQVAWETALAAVTATMIRGATERAA